jgi:hypothetical protein
MSEVPRTTLNSGADMPVPSLDFERRAQHVDDLAALVPEQRVGPGPGTFNRS